MSDRPERPELPVDLLADLDAGLLDPGRAAEVRAAASRDPEAAAVLGGLAATRAELAALADPPLPDELAARWDAALAAEADAAPPGHAPGDTGAAAGVPRADRGTAAPPGPGRAGASDGTTGGPDGRTTAGAPPPARTAGPQPPGQGDGDDARPAGGSAVRRRSGPHRAQASTRPPVDPARRRRPRPALLAAAVLVAAAVAGALGAPGAPAPSPDGVDLVREGLAVRGDFDVGELADPARRAGCLRSAAPPGVAPDAPLLGGRDVVVAGREGVLLLLATGGRGRLHVVVVSPDCGPGGGALLAAQTIG